MKKIKIKGKEYIIKYTIRALFIYEQITKKSFKVETLLDNYIFFYSIILANNKDNLLDWDDFLDAIDTDNSIIDTFNSLLIEQDAKEKVFGLEDEDGKKKD